MNELTKTEQAIEEDWEVLGEGENITYQQVWEAIDHVREHYLRRPAKYCKMAHDFIVRNPEVPVEGVQFYLETQGIKKPVAYQVSHEVFGRFLIP